MASGIKKKGKAASPGNRVAETTTTPPLFDKSIGKMYKQLKKSNLKLEKNKLVINCTLLKLNDIEAELKDLKHKN